MKVTRFFLVLIAAIQVSPAAVRCDFQLQAAQMPYNVMPTEFSFTTPDYLTVGSFTPDPFDITFGSWGPGTSNAAIATAELTQGYVGISSIFFCFSFGSAASTMIPCGVQPKENRAGLAGGFFGSVPTAPGTWTALAPLGYYGLDSSLIRLNLTITEAADVPEPGTGALTAIAGLASCLALWRRVQLSTPS